MNEHLTKLNSILADIGLANPDHAAKCMEGLAHVEAVEKWQREAVSVLKEANQLAEEHTVALGQL